MAPLQNAYRPDDLRNAIVDCHLDEMFIRDAPAKYRVPSRVLHQLLNDLATIYLCYPDCLGTDWFDRGR